MIAMVVVNLTTIRSRPRRPHIYQKTGDVRANNNLQKTGDVRANNNLQNTTQKIQYEETRTQIKTGGEVRCSGR